MGEITLAKTDTGRYYLHKQGHAQINISTALVPFIPFKHGDKVLITVEDNALVIEVLDNHDNHEVE